jgi:hypothetical protein
MVNRSETKTEAGGPRVGPTTESNTRVGGASPTDTDGTLDTEEGVEGSASEHGEGMGEAEHGHASVDPHPDGDDDFDDDGSGRESVEAVIEDHADDGAGDDGGAGGD